MQPKKKKYDRQHLLWGYIFIAPTAIGLFVLNIKPAFDTVLMSFQQTNGLSDGVWVGLMNYKKLFHDPEVWQSLLNTFKFAIISVPLIIALSLVTAVLLNQKIKFRGLYRTLFFLPVVAAPSAVAMIWRWLFNSDFGLINTVIEKFGGEKLSWLSNPDMAIYTIIIVGIWSSIGYNMILFLSGLQEIPKDYYESAEIDGAGPVKQFFSITLPLVTPTLFFVTVTTVIGALQVFDAIFMMIPAMSEAMYKSQSLAYLFYKYSFMLQDKGYGSTIVVFLLVIILMITMVQLKLQKRWVNY